LPQEQGSGYNQGGGTGEGTRRSPRQVSVKKYLLDTNVRLRFLLDDHPELSRAAAGLFQQAADEECLLILTELGIAEAVWVLTSFYNLERQKVAEGRAKLLIKAGVHCRREPLGS
jgi:predicted nucleic-acid-binding protein